MSEEIEMQEVKKDVLKEEKSCDDKSTCSKDKPCKCNPTTEYSELMERRKEFKVEFYHQQIENEENFINKKTSLLVGFCSFLIVSYGIFWGRHAGCYPPLKDNTPSNATATEEFYGCTASPIVLTCITLLGTVISFQMLFTMVFSFVKWKRLVNEMDMSTSQIDCECTKGYNQNHKRDVYSKFVSVFFVPVLMFCAWFFVMFLNEFPVEGGNVFTFPLISFVVVFVILICLFVCGIVAFFLVDKNLENFSEKIVEVEGGDVVKMDQIKFYQHEIGRYFKNIVHSNSVETEYLSMAANYSSFFWIAYVNIFPVSPATKNTTYPLLHVLCVFSLLFNLFISVKIIYGEFKWKEYRTLLDSSIRISNSIFYKGEKNEEEEEFSKDPNFVKESVIPRIFDSHHHSFLFGMFNMSFWVCVTIVTIASHAEMDFLGRNELFAVVGTVFLIGVFMAIGVDIFIVILLKIKIEKKHDKKAPEITDILKCFEEKRNIIKKCEIGKRGDGKCNDCK